MPTWDGIVKQDQKTRNARKFYERITTETLLKTLLGDKIEPTIDTSIPPNTAFVTDNNETYRLVCNCCKNGEKALDKCPHTEDEVLYNLIQEKYRKMEMLLKNFYIQRNVSFDVPSFNSILEKHSKIHVAYIEPDSNKSKSHSCIKKQENDEPLLPHVHKLNHIPQIVPNPDPNLTGDEAEKVVFGHNENKECDAIRESIMKANEDFNLKTNFGDGKEPQIDTGDAQTLNLKKKNKIKKKLLNKLENPDDIIGKTILTESESTVNCFLSEHTLTCVDSNDIDNNNSENCNPAENDIKNRADDKKSDELKEDKKNSGDNSSSNLVELSNEKKVDLDGNKMENRDQDENVKPNIPTNVSVTQQTKKEKKINRTSTPINNLLIPSQNAESSANTSDPNYHPLIRPKVATHIILSSTDNSYDETSVIGGVGENIIQLKKNKNVFKPNKDESHSDVLSNDSIDLEELPVKQKKKKNGDKNKDKNKKNKKKNGQTIIYNESGPSFLTKTKKNPDDSSFSEIEQQEIQLAQSQPQKSSSSSSSSSSTTSSSDIFSSSEGNINNVNARILKNYWKETIRLINRYNLAIIQEMMKNPCPKCEEVFLRGGQLRQVEKANKNKKRNKIMNRNGNKNDGKIRKQPELVFRERKNKNSSSGFKDSLLDNESSHSCKEVPCDTPQNITLLTKTPKVNYKNEGYYLEDEIDFEPTYEKAEPGVILASLTYRYKNMCPDCIPMCHILTAMAQENVLFERIERSNKPNYEETIKWIFELCEHISTNKVTYYNNGVQIKPIMGKKSGLKKHKISKFKTISPKANRKGSYIDTNLTLPGMSLMISFTGLIKPYSIDDEYAAMKRGEIKIGENKDLKGRNEGKLENNDEKENMENKVEVKKRGFGDFSDSKEQEDEDLFGADGFPKYYTSDGKPVEYIRTKGKHKKLDITFKSTYSFDDFVDKYREVSGHRSKLPSICYKLALFSGILLSALKLFSFIVSNSMIMMAATIDSCLDILSSLILLITSRIANSKKNNYRQFPVGKKRIQTVGVLVFACIMSAFSLQILSQAIIDISSGPGSSEFGVWPIVTMAAAVLTKATLFVVTKLSIRKLRKNGDPKDVLEIDGMDACAQDHRNDLMSNGFGLIFGVVSQYAWYLDPVASMCLSLFIIYNWGKTAFEQIKSLLGCGASPDFVQLVTYICLNFDSRIVSVSDVVCYHTGTQITVDLLLIFSSSTDIKTYNTVTRELKNYIEALAEVEKCNIRVTTTDDPYC